MPHPQSPFGLVFSGGAAYGFANIGVWEVLKREGFVPSAIAGSSMGAIVGALAACNVPVTTMRKLAEEIRLSTVARLSRSPLKGGLQGGFLRQNIENLLRPLLGDRTIGDCAIPFVCVAARVKEPIAWSKIIVKGFTASLLKRTEFTILPPSTPLIDAILASSAVPVIFSPVRIEGELYIDFLDFGAIPVDALQQVHHPPIVIATDTAPRFRRLKRILPPGWKEFLTLGEEAILHSRSSCDLAIEPHLTGSPWRFDHAKRFMDAGVRATEEALPKIAALLR